MCTMDKKDAYKAQVQLLIFLLNETGHLDHSKWRNNDLYQRSDKDVRFCNYVFHVALR